MNLNEKTANVDAFLEDYAAELTNAAYPVFLRFRNSGSWLDLELNLWKALAETFRQARIPSVSN